jgi:WD40-like Beta Propeller Repeat
VNRTAHLLTAFGVLLAALLGAGPAQAAPIHPFLESLTLEGPNPPTETFDRACGSAVDSAGNVYVASAGNGEIDIFDGEHTHLASIANANEPCGLAVDSKGNLYASETKAGNVVKYIPSAYPFAGTPTYGAPITVDSSGEAKGIAVDPFDDWLYVARGDHLAAYQSDGTLGINEVQWVLIKQATGGTLTLSFEGEESGPLPHNATPAEVQLALEGLTTIGAGNVSVTEGPHEVFPDYLITFTGLLGSTDLESIVTDSSGLLGDPSKEASAEAALSEISKGFDGLIGVGILSEATGAAAFTYEGKNESLSPREETRYVFAADDATDEIQVFSGDPLGPVHHRRTIDSFEAEDGEVQDLAFGDNGAYLGVDRSNGHVLVYDAGREVVNEFEATGASLSQIASPEPPFAFEDADPTPISVLPELDELQVLDTASTGGTFTLSLDGEVTAPIGSGAAPAAVRSALAALPNVGAGNVFVDYANMGTPKERYVIGFVGDLGSRDISSLSVDASDLTGTAVLATRREGSGPGRLHVGSGLGTGAKLLSFGPLTPPSRTSLPTPEAFKSDVSGGTKNACGVAVDSAGNVYVATGASIRVFSPSGQKLTDVTTGGQKPCDLSVDSKGNVYAREQLSNASRVGLYAPEGGVFPPQEGTSYSGPTTIEEGEQISINGSGLNPANDHLLVTRKHPFEVEVVEHDSADSGSGVIRKIKTGISGFGNTPYDVAVHGDSGDIYVAHHRGERSHIVVVDAADTRVLGRINGSGSPKGRFTSLSGANIAVDQSNGHVLVAAIESRGAVEEFEASGAFVGRWGTSFQQPGSTLRSAIAVDESGGVTDDNIYAAYDQPEPGSPNLWSFGPLGYGQPPVASTTGAGDLGDGSATLNGEVNPRGALLEDCHFEYVEETSFEVDGFAGAEEDPCAESFEEIGKGTAFVPVHAEVSGLDLQQRYLFRLVAANEFGPSNGESVLFGPPLVAPKPPQSISYTEATVRAVIDPSGLKTAYSAQYVDAAGFKAGGYANAAQTAPVQLSPGEPTEVQIPLFGLDEGTSYHFRVVAENEAAAVDGPDQELTTQTRPEQDPDCPNAALRTGFSVSLPDCRAYELVTPADTGGRAPKAIAVAQFNTWPVTPNGEDAGSSVAFSITGAALPGVGGSGLFDQFEAVRDPNAGWFSEVRSPTFAQIGGEPASPGGFSSDHDYSLWDFVGGEGGLAAGEYLGTPSGFELLGRGDLGSDPVAEGHYLSDSGKHVIFSSSVSLEDDAPPAGVRAVYDRSAGNDQAQVVSLLPGEGTPATAATYEGSSEDGSTIAFTVADALYLRRDGVQTLTVAPAPSTFAGMSQDGERVFYEHPPTDGLFVFDAGSEATTEIAIDARFVTVSSDGSRAYFESTQSLDDANEGVLGEPNLYLWDGDSIRLVAVLDPQDFNAFGGFSLVHHGHWKDCLKPADSLFGSASCPSRSTPDGEVLVFQSHRSLTAYDGGGHSQIYRYDSTAGSLLCVSCDPSKAPATADAFLQDVSQKALNANAPTSPPTIIPNVTNDGKAVFFETAASLLPEDANAVRDVYEWKAENGDDCTRSDGCLFLISSGQGEQDSFLYGMTPDGSDVFFTTTERLLGTDLVGSPSIYDARSGGGFPEDPAPAPCEGDACQGQASSPPSLPGAASAHFTGPGDLSPRKPRARRCPKGKRRGMRRGKPACVRKSKAKAKHSPGERRQKGVQR